MTTSRRFVFLAAAALLLTTTGCRFLLDTFLGTDDKLPGEQYSGQYWKEGYGFNNPNAEKMKDPAYRATLGR